MEGQHSKESIPSSSKPLFPLFPAVETVPSDKTEAGKWRGCIYISNATYVYIKIPNTILKPIHCIYLNLLVGCVNGMVQGMVS